jgi:hypothetical protein
LSEHLIPPAGAERWAVGCREAEFDESRRLTRSAKGAPEPLRTQEPLRPVPPPAPAAVLDAGGGAGAHARRLTEDGRRVRVVDPVPRHAGRARAAGRPEPLPGTAQLPCPAPG